MIKILVTGDFCPINRIGPLNKTGDYKAIFNDFLSVLDGNDLNITNLECPLHNGKAAIGKTGPCLKADESMAKILTNGHFNLATLANNHIMDFGELGLKSTIEACKRENVSTVGAGFNLQEAQRVFYKTIKHKVLAVINITENEWSTTTGNTPGTNPLNPVINYYDIKEARSKADLVILIVHGGHEGYYLPSPRIVETCRFFIDAGADIVVGHHTHCFSGYEKYKGGFIFYSLGNFIFDWENYRDSDWNYGYAVKFFFDGKGITFNVIPYKQCDKNPGIFLLNDSEKQDFNDKLNSLNYTLSEDALLNKEWSNFSKKMRESYLINFENCNSRIYKSLRHRRLIPGFLSKKKKMLLLNLIRCESHRDLSIECLKP